MARFCVKCGAPVDETTGLCTKCNEPSRVPEKNTVSQNSGSGRASNYDAEQIKAERAIKLAEEKAKKKEEKKRAWKDAKKRYKHDVSAKKAIIKKAKKAKKKAKFAAMSAGQKVGRVFLKFLFIVLILALIVGSVYLGLRRLGLFSGGNNQDEISVSTDSTVAETEEPSASAGSIGNYDPPTGDMPDDYEVSRPDADEFFEENSEIVSEIDASKAGRTEAEVYKNLTDRGFTDMPITVNYTMNGEYGEPKEISSTGSEKHPIYSTYYITESGDVWNVYEINGAVFANPVSYNMKYDRDVQVIISETDNITSYDSTLNKFYVTKPNETALDVRKVDKIDAETLDNLTAREINKL